jgi:hypothetical protein
MESVRGFEWNRARRGSYWYLKGIFFIIPCVLTCNFFSLFSVTYLLALYKFGGLSILPSLQYFFFPSERDEFPRRFITNCNWVSINLWMLLRSQLLFSSDVWCSASDFSREYDGACLQMRLSYSPAAHFFLFLVRWTDCSLAGALGLLRILIYKVHLLYIICFISVFSSSCFFIGILFLGCTSQRIILHSLWTEH